MGVVTDFDIEPVHLDGVQVGQVAIEVDRDGAALRRWSAFMSTAPRELTLSGMLGVSGRQLVAVFTVVVASNDPRRADAALAPLLAQRGVHHGGMASAQYSDLVPRSHLHANLGQQAATTTNALLRQLDAATARALVEVATHPTRPFVQLRAIGGAAHDLPVDATAYAHRDAEVLVTATVFPPQSRDDLESSVRALRHHSVGAYRNFESHPTDETFDRAFPGPTGQRVRQLTQRYDPDGLLRRSTPPTVGH